MLKLLWQNKIELLRHVLTGFGVLFLFIESYEVVTDSNLKMHYILFVSLGFVIGAILFALDGWFRSGYLRNEVVISTDAGQTQITLKYGDIFHESGWKAIGVNDFFDDTVDEDLVSSRSLHGIVLNDHWGQNRADWRKQIQIALNKVTGVPEARSKGKRTRYPIGTTARASSAEHNFLFVVLGETSLKDNTTSANTEQLIRAVRGLAREARAACSMKPLIVPLMGDGLSRINMPPTILIDLIITALVEESRYGKITGEIKIVLHTKHERSTNLKNHVRKIAHGK